MKLLNTFLINNKKIIDIIPYEGFSSKYQLILEDNTKIDATWYSIKIFLLCPDCGKIISAGFRPQLFEKVCYCSHCRAKNHNPFKGKHHSKEFCEHLSKQRKGTYHIGSNNPFYGKKHKDIMSPEKYEKWRNSCKEAGKRNSGKNNPMFGEKLKDHMSPEKYELWRQHITETMEKLFKQPEAKLRVSQSQLKLKEKDPLKYSEMKRKAGKISQSKQYKTYKKNNFELLVDEWLDEHLIPHDYSIILYDKDTESNMQFDFGIKSKRILIECQGDYYHANPKYWNEDGSDGKFKFNDTNKNAWKRDEEKKNFANKHNFKLITIWEDDIVNNDYSSLECLIDICKDEIEWMKTS